MAQQMVDMVTAARNASTPRSFVSTVTFKEDHISVPSSTRDPRSKMPAPDSLKNAKAEFSFRKASLEATQARDRKDPFGVERGKREKERKKEGKTERKNDAQDDRVRHKKEKEKERQKRRRERQYYDRAAKRGKKNYSSSEESSEASFSSSASEEFLDDPVDGVSKTIVNNGTINVHECPEEVKDFIQRFTAGQESG